MSLDRCRVVLVRPHFAGNLGAVARVMRNFGLRHLVLVDPIANPQHRDAAMMAVHGLDVLTSARTVPTLAEAVADCALVLATSGEVGGLARKGFWGTPEEKVPALLAALDRGPAAVVFGPEPSGLTVDEIAARAEEGDLDALLLPMESALPHLPRLVVSPADARRLREGQALPAEAAAGAAGLPAGSLVRVAVEEQGLVCVARIDAAGRRVQPVRVVG